MFNCQTLHRTLIVLTSGHTAVHIAADLKTSVAIYVSKQRGSQPTHTQFCENGPTELLGKKYNHSIILYHVSDISLPVYFYRLATRQMPSRTEILVVITPGYRPRGN